MNAVDRGLVAIGGSLVLLSAGFWNVVAMRGHYVDPYASGIPHYAVRPDIALYGVGVALLGASRILSGIASIFRRR